MEAKDLRILLENEGIECSPYTDYIAEISFQAGRREVVEWIADNKDELFYEGLYGSIMGTDKWHSRLKEWSIEKT